MAALRTEFQVVPVGTEWEIKRDGKAFLTVQSKQVAIDEVVVQAGRVQPSSVQVKRQDGSVEEEASFGEDTSTTKSRGQRKHVPSGDADGRQQDQPTG